MRIENKYFQLGPVKIRTSTEVHLDADDIEGLKKHPTNIKFLSRLCETEEGATIRFGMGTGNRLDAYALASFLENKSEDE